MFLGWKRGSLLNDVVVVLLLVLPTTYFASREVSFPLPFQRGRCDRGVDEPGKFLGASGSPCAALARDSGDFFSLLLLLVLVVRKVRASTSLLGGGL